MKFPQIQIRTTDIQLDMHIKKPEQYIRQPKATQTIEQPQAIIDIETKPGAILIDSSQARRDIGLRTPKESVLEYAKKGKEAVLKAIAKTVQEGNKMMYSAGKGNGPVISEIAKENTMPKVAPINIKFIPSYGSVKFTHIPAEVNIEVIPQKPKIDVQINKPIHKYIPGDVIIDVIQYPSVEIDVIK